MSNPIDKYTIEVLPPEDDPVELLASQLHAKMDHLDPSDDDVEWEQLHDSKKEFYRTCIIGLCY